MSLPGINKYGYPSGSNNANSASHNKLQTQNKMQNDINNYGGRKKRKYSKKNKRTLIKNRSKKYSKKYNKNNRLTLKRKIKKYKPKNKKYRKYQTIKYKKIYIKSDGNTKRGGNSGSMRVVVPQASTYGMTSTTPNDANASSVDISKTILQSNSNAQYDTDTSTKQYII